MNYYALYKFRNTDKRYPKDFLQIHTEINTSWLIIGRELSDPEYEMVLREIKRLSK